jgi:type 1 glutamine amidotransferase
MKSPPIAFFVALGALSCFSARAGLPAIELTDEWKEKIRTIAPETPAASPKKERNILIFSLATGYVHWCIPHTDAVVEILGDKTGAFTSTRTVDIEVFLPENLAKYDAVVLNNTCPDRKDRHVFRDVLINKMDKFGQKYAEMTLPEREALAEKLYNSLVSYVAEGGGLVLLHGAISTFNNSEEFSDLIGGSFDFHPPQQDVTLLPVSPDHPMLTPFGGKPLVHHDEPYVMNGAYSKLNFHPLLEMDIEKLSKPGRLKNLPDLPRYVSWIKPYKKGRVFYCSPSHNAQSFEKPELLDFILRGMQYAVGDLNCNDQPVQKRN